MKKFAIFITMLSIICFSGTSAFSEDQEYQQPRERREQGMMDSEGMMGGGQGMMGGKGLGMKGGGPASMVALMDGSIVVLSGNKLTKYDSELNVIKEVEIKGGPSAMDKMGGMERMKNTRRISEEKIDEFPEELSDSVPAMLEAAALPPVEPEGVRSEPGVV